MYLRMLKRDLKDKVALNITLFLFMILASIFTVISTLLLFCKLSGTGRTYKKSNTSDFVLRVEQSISDLPGQRERIESRLRELPEFSSLNRMEYVMSPGSMLDYDHSSTDDNLLLSYYDFFLSKMPEKSNLVYDGNDQQFTVENGCIAIPQDLKNASGSKIGDKIRITTPLGNIYEFTVSAIFKDPSSEGCTRLLFSDTDLELLRNEYPVKYDVYAVYLKPFHGDYVNRLLDIGTSLISYLEKEYGSFAATKTLTVSNNGIIGLIVSLIMSVVSIFMLFMVFTTIHFSLKSAIKREEKEIGMMKAIGVYSFSYRALFAVKYIAFAVAGGVLGIPAALPLGRVFMNSFIFHTVLPDRGLILLLALAAVVVNILIIIGFTFLSLRKMKKISVMDAIHGENRGERFKKLSGMFLYKKKHMQVPFFLAVSDILGRLKRYVFLILAYVAGVSMILLVIQIKDSVISEDYIKNYWQMGDHDFHIAMDNSYYENLFEKTGSGEGSYRLLNETFQKNGIPAKIEFYTITNAEMTYQNRKYMYRMKFGDLSRDDIRFTKGGKAPKLRNEIAIQYYHAKQVGLHIGDTISLTYRKYNEDNISSREVTESFLITAFFDSFGVSVPDAIMGEAFEGAVEDYLEDFQYKLTCDAKDYDRYFKQMDDLFTEEEIRFIPKKEVLPYLLGSFCTMFNLMLLVVSIVVAIVLTLLTALYQNIFIEQEAADVAVMKSMGFYKTEIKQWQYLRIMLLVCVSIVASHLVVATVGNLIVNRIVMSSLRILTFNITLKFVSNFLIVPIGVILLITISLLPVLKGINRLEIGRMRNE